MVLSPRRLFSILCFVCVSIPLVLFSTPVTASVPGQACPSNIDANDCVANDLQPTGAEVISGPESCTTGEIFAATVRIWFENGGGANERYSIGFFVGEKGEPAIGGDFCTFDSLNPISNNPTPLGGPYAELNGDACGDIQKSEPTYKDIELDSLACKDDDGDGKVDLSYVLTWVNNGNKANCQNPLDPANFEPNPPKCLSDLQYDLPIDVEEPPAIEVAKGASPSILMEPGGLVRFPVTVINTSPSASDPVTITRIVDQVEGEAAEDITGIVDCVMPFTLAPGQSKTCYFSNTVEGVAGDIITDTVTVYGEDDEGEAVESSDSATVTIEAGDGGGVRPGDLRLVKFASPHTINEPGGTVRYDVLVANASTTPVTLTSLVDDLYGDLNGKGSCSVPQTLSGVNSIYFCAFEEQVTGEPGDVITDTITAQGWDDLPMSNLLIKEDSASVIIGNVPSAIEVTKVANTETVPEPGGSVIYSLQVQNTSTVDTVTINSLLDSAIGVPKGDCATPFTLAPGEAYQCDYPAVVTGEEGDAYTNVVTALGIDDDGRPVAGFDAATVFITGLPPELKVVKLAIPPYVAAQGGSVLYAVAIHNISASNDPITITGLVDEIDGQVTSLDKQGTCDISNLVLQPPPGVDSFYLCRFAQTLPAGSPGDTVEDIVTASGVDDEGTAVEASDNAVVTYVTDILDVPQLTVVKLASPEKIEETDGEVTFTVYVANISTNGQVNLNLTVTSLIDDVFGDLAGKGDCGSLVGSQLATGEIASCSFTETLFGNAGETHTNTVTATAKDVLDREVSGNANAVVTFTDVPSSLQVTKTATPTTLQEPGGEVSFEILVYNSSQTDRILLNSLVDNVHGDLMAQGLCPPETSIFPGRDPYRCVFTANVEGPGGFEEVNTVTASGVDDDSMTVEAVAQASVSILDTPPSMTTKKSADPVEVPANGGMVSFTSTTTNTSISDTITLNSLTDSVFGDLNGKGDCAIPQTLLPGQSYVCSFQEFLIQENTNENHRDEITVNGESDDGDPVADRANAIVVFIEQLEVIKQLEAIPTLGRWGVGVFILLLGWFGFRRFREH